MLALISVCLIDDKQCHASKEFNGGVRERHPDLFQDAVHELIIGHFTLSWTTLDCSSAWILISSSSTLSSSVSTGVSSGFVMDWGLELLRNCLVNSSAASLWE